MWKDAADNYLVDRVSLLKAYDFVHACGKIHEAREFAIHIMDAVGRLCPYDQGRIYFYNENGNICDQHLINIDPNLVHQYHSYYAMADGGRYSVPMHRKDRMIPEGSQVPRYIPGGKRHFISEFSVPLSGQTLWHPKGISFGHNPPPCRRRRQGGGLPHQCAYWLAMTCFVLCIMPLVIQFLFVFPCSNKVAL